MSKVDFPKFKKYYGEEVAECFKCNSISLVKKYNLYFCNECGYFADKTKLIMDSTPCTYLETSSISKKYKDLLFELFSICNGDLFSEYGVEALQYLTDTRKIDIDTITKYNLGLISNNSKVLKNFLLGNLEEFKFLNYIYGDKKFFNFNEVIIFPIFSFLDGEPIGYATRSYRDRKFFHSPNNLLYSKKNVLYGTPNISDSIRSSRTAYIVEGMFDVLSLEKIVSEPVYGLIGGKNSNGLMALYRNGIVKLKVASDNDLAGDVIFQTLKDRWSSYFLVERFEFPKEYKDVDEWVNK